MITHVHQQQPERAISRLCQVVEVSRSWSYEKQSRPEMSEAEVDLRDAIEQIILDFPGSGSRRVTHALKRAGWIVNHKRVLRGMRA
jgi:putative transposase